MDTLLLTETIKSVGDGNYAKGIFSFLIFAVIWMEVRGLKKSVNTMSKSIAKSFEAGEHRFTEIESRLTKVEHIIQP